MNPDLKIAQLEALIERQAADFQKANLDQQALIAQLRTALMNHAREAALLLSEVDGLRQELANRRHVLSKALDTGLIAVAEVQ